MGVVGKPPLRVCCPISAWHPLTALGNEKLVFIQLEVYTVLVALLTSQQVHADVNEKGPPD